MAVGASHAGRLGSLRVLVPGLSPEMRSVGVAELKDSGTLFSVPIISKNASRWSRDIIALANYLNG